MMPADFRQSEFCHTEDDLTSPGLQQIEDAKQVRRTKKSREKKKAEIRVWRQQIQQQRERSEQGQDQAKEEWEWKT